MRGVEETRHGGTPCSWLGLRNGGRGGGHHRRGRRGRYCRHGGLHRSRRGRRRGLQDVHAEVRGDAREPRRVPLPDRPELPVRAVPVQLAEHHRRLAAGLGRHVVAGHLDAAVRVGDPDVRAAHLPEALAPLRRVVDRHRENDLLHVGGDLREPDLDLPAVGAAAGAALVADRAVRAPQVVEEDEVPVRADLPVRPAQQRAGVQVVPGPGRPAEADPDHPETGGLLAQGDVAALRQGHTHGLPPPPYEYRCNLCPTTTTL